MPSFLPFHAYYPCVDDIEEFVLMPKDKRNISAILQSKEDSLTFAQMIRPTQWAKRDRMRMYQQVRRTFDRWREMGVLHARGKVYLQYTILNRLSQEEAVGLVGIVDMADFKKKRIKKHEKTVKKRESLFAQYLSVVRFQAEPVLLAADIAKEFMTSLSGQEILSFMDEEGHHRLNVVDPSDYDRIQNYCANLPAFYIADGHHRMGSTARYDAQYASPQQSTYCMAMLVPGDDLIIHDYNRVVISLRGLTKAQFLEQLSIHFVIHDLDSHAYPRKKGEVIMYLGTYYRLIYKGEPELSPGTIDVNIIESHAIKGILGVENSRKNKRILYTKGTGDVQGVKAMADVVDSYESAVGFAFYPVSFESIKHVADQNQKLPPKSTFINPKLPSGLLFYDMTAI